MTTIQQRFLVLAAMFAVVWGSVVHGAPVQPLDTSNMSPIVFIHGLPSMGPTSVLAPGAMSVSGRYEVANNYTNSRKANESVIFDGESTRGTLALRLGVFDGFNASLLLPYVKHSGGNLDSMIESWHSFFGLPNGGRDDAVKNRLLYFYQKNGVAKLNNTETSDGVGDVQLIATWRLLESPPVASNPGLSHLVFNMAAKAPTGDADELHGSGGAGASAWLTGDKLFKAGLHEGAVYGALGFMALQEGDVIADQQNSWVAFGGLGAGFEVNPHVNLQAQLDAHSSFYSNSALDQVEGAALMLTLGGKIIFSRQWDLDLSVVEDIVVDHAPDVVFQMALTWRR